jgi:hypothetical protein
LFQLTTSKPSKRRLSDLNLFISNLKDIQNSYHTLVTDLRAVQLPPSLPTLRQLTHLGAQAQAQGQHPMLVQRVTPHLYIAAPLVQTVSPLQRTLQTPTTPAPATSATKTVQPTSATGRIIPTPTSNAATTPAPSNAAKTTDSGNPDQAKAPEPKPGVKIESGKDNAEDASWLKWPVGIYMILIGFPLCLKGYAWFTPWLSIP